MFQVRVTAEIEMRQVQDSDAAALFAMTERNRAHLRQWLPWVDHTLTVDDTRRFINGAAEQFYAGRGPNAAIWVNREIVGSIGCHAFDLANRSCSVGYCLDAESQGRGIITRCCAALVDYLFHNPRLHRVVIQCGTGNHKSCGVPQRLGFTREGVLHEAEWVNDRWVDLVVWSMLEQNWKKVQQAFSPAQ